MAVIDRIDLHIGEHSGTAFIEVTWGATGNQIDIETRQAYREVVELVGLDIGPGQDGVSDPIADGVISDRIRTFTAAVSSFADTKQKRLPVGALDEDGPLRSSQIAARISLIPLPPRTIARLSNVINRPAPGLHP